MLVTLWRYLFWLHLQGWKQLCTLWSWRWRPHVPRNCQKTFPDTYSVTTPRMKLISTYISSNNFILFRKQLWWTIRHDTCHRTTNIRTVTQNSCSTYKLQWKTKISWTILLPIFCSIIYCSPVFLRAISFLYTKNVKSLYTESRRYFLSSIHTVYQSSQIIT